MEGGQPVGLLLGLAQHRSPQWFEGLQGHAPLVVPPRARHCAVDEERAERVGCLGVEDQRAVLFPEEPATIRAKGQPGDGELARTIMLRFAPSEIGLVFPSKTVGKKGDPWLRAQAVKTFRHKIGHKWYTPAGNPTVVPTGVTLLDADTTEGQRRFYEIDRARRRHHGQPPALA